MTQKEREEERGGGKGGRTERGRDNGGLKKRQDKSRGHVEA